MDLKEGEVVDAVDADDGGFVLFLVPESDFDGLGAVDNVVVGEDMSLIINDKARALALLGDGAEEEVAADDGGAGDVDDGWEGALVDGDVLLLFGVKCGGGLSLSEREISKWAAEIRYCGCVL